MTSRPTVSHPRPRRGHSAGPEVILAGRFDGDRRSALYHAIMDTVRRVIEQGGRNDEYDLFGNRGGYVRLMDKNAAGNPCPECGTVVQKIQYLGGACYLCPACQV